MAGGGLWTAYENANFRMKIVTIKQLDSRGIWDLVIVLVGYGSNNNRLRVCEKVDWTPCHSDHQFLPQRVLFAIKIFWVWAISNQ